MSDSTAGQLFIHKLFIFPCYLFTILYVCFVYSQVVLGVIYSLVQIIYCDIIYPVYIFSGRFSAQTGGQKAKFSVIFLPNL